LARAVKQNAAAAAAARRKERCIELPRSERRRLG
jgi:hypothetical protein